MWKELTQKFLAKYVLLGKTAKLRNDMTTFAQWDKLYEVLEHFKVVIRRCPHHDHHIGLQIQTFYNGLGITNCSMIDATTCGTLKTPEATYRFLEKLSSNSY